MNLLIKSAKIIDLNSKFHSKIVDIYIKDGKIDKIGKSLNISKSVNNKTQVFSAKNLHISPGWFDMHANFGEPGYEHKETINSGSLSALSGGFTGVLIMPNTNPKLDNKGLISYIKKITKNNIVDIIPAGNLTKNGLGKNMVDMYDMHKEGCLAFTDDKDSINSNKLLKIAMLYSKDFDGLIMNFPYDKSLSDGVINEGITSTKLGLRGIPSISEEIMLDRDLALCEYTKSKFHSSYISTINSIKKIRNAKRKGLNITADVCVYNTFLTDNYLNDFDSRFKTLPPLRTKNDIRAIIKALKDGTIDVITMDHTPQEQESKKIEFDNAAFGIIGLESGFGLIGKYLLPHIELSQIINLLSTNARKILKLPEIKIDKGEKANITMFDPTLEWELKYDNLKSLSYNTPFLGHKLKGKPLAIYNNKQFKKC